MNINECTFQSVFGEHIASDGTKYKINKIEIPIIQRDYAQGRQTSTVKRVRERFLNNIFNAIKNHRHLTLDFVYGEINDGKLTPLDGQQRLTTLFLLHWYASKKDNIDEDQWAFLRNFSYYTRPSSDDFCQKLTEFKPRFEIVLSDEIKDQTWFQYQWQNDPTITGMLVMIDAIHKLFGKETGLWHALVDEQSVSFYFLPISEMGLTDELYIKMNSRGKPLTSFEHFKAEFESLAEKVNHDIAEEFRHKFDLDWTDMLFPYRGVNDIIDDEFMRYFFFVSDLLCYIQDKPLQKDEFKLAKMLYSFENPDAIDNLNFLKSAYDCWCGFNIDEFFGKHFSGSQFQSGKTKIFQDNLNLFKQCCDEYGEYVDSGNRTRKFPLSLTLLLYAVIVYLQNRQNISENDFQRRIRIVRNLIWNSRFEIRADAQRNNMPVLLAETKEIILTGTIPEKGAYNQRQREEELAKSEWLKQNRQYEEELFHLEDHNLLYGCIAIIGTENPSNFNKFRELFNICERKLISRALLTIGNYSQRLDWRWQLGTRNDSTWRDLFHPSNQRKGFENTKNALNSLLNRLEEVSDNALLENVEHYLNDIATPKDLRYYFVKYPVMLSDTYGMYYSYDDGAYHTAKMHTSERLVRHWNVFTLALHDRLERKYGLGDYGDRLQLTEAFSLQYFNDKIVIYESDADGNEINQNVYQIEQDENGIDIKDRVEQGVEVVKQIVGE